MKNWFGTNKKDITDAGYTQPTESLPVATLVSEESAALYHTLVQPSAPMEPSLDAPAVGGGGGCCASSNNPATAASSSSGTNRHDAYLDNDPTISRFPMMMRECPSCNRESRTRVTTAPSCKTWIASGIMVCVFWPLCWIPLVTDQCKDTEHFCVSCGAKVGMVAAFQDCCVEHRA